MLGSILLVDDEPDFRYSTKVLLEDQYDIFEADGAKSALSFLKDTYVDLVLLDINMPKVNGLDLLDQIKGNYPEIEVIMLTAQSDTKSAIRATKSGAYDYMVKPFDPDHLPIICKRALEKRILNKHSESLRVQLNEKKNFSIIGESSAMKKVFGIIDKVQDKNVAVLISGETGTGKELVAKAIHYKGKRRKSPFIALNCGTIPNDLMESELFGYEKGAFTSADNAKPGLFELADGGTLFLDEINSMPYSMQVKLLRVLQEKEVTRLGGTRSFVVDVRIISASNNRLKDLVADNKFREDLLHRINTIEINLPSLQERSKKDLVLLTDYFLTNLCKEHSVRKKRISEAAYTVLFKYSWPGNIRELRNILERLVIMEDGNIIHFYHLPLDIRLNQKTRMLNESLGLRELVEDFEAKVIMGELEKNHYKVSITSDNLKIHRTTLLAKVKTYGIDTPTGKKS